MQADRTTSVRTAASRDISALCDLYLDFHEFHAERLPNRLVSLVDVWEDEKVRLAERLSEIIMCSDAEILVVEKDGRVVGFTELYLREDTEAGGRAARTYCHLQSMFIAEPHRRGGLGRLLLSESETWARSRGAAEIQVDVWEFTEGPAEFYEQCEYRTYRRSLVRSLGKDDK
jgi:GNAT superfamily N-acetyltransferase